MERLQSNYGLDRRDIQKNGGVVQKLKSLATAGEFVQNNYFPDMMTAK